MFHKHNIIVKNIESKVSQLLTPKALKDILAKPKLNKQIEIMGFADERGRLILNTTKEATEMYKPHIKTVEAPAKPLEELEKNKDMGEKKDDMD